MCYNSLLLQKKKKTFLKHFRFSFSIYVTERTCAWGTAVGEEQEGLAMEGRSNSERRRKRGKRKG